MASRTRKKSTRRPAAGLQEKRQRMQRLVREYNELVREYNALSQANWKTAQKQTAAGEAAAKRLVRKYNQLAAKGRALEAAARAYQKAKTR